MLVTRKDIQKFLDVNAEYIGFSSNLDYFTRFYNNYIINFWAKNDISLDIRETFLAKSNTYILDCGIRVGIEGGFCMEVSVDYINMFVRKLKIESIYNE